MVDVLDRPRGTEGVRSAPGGRARPVVLGTLSVRVHPNAERVALESAAEAGVPLIIANMIALPPYPITMILAPQYATLPHEEDLDAVRETAARAAQRGIVTELLRVSSRRPVRALLELVSEREAGLLVFGPDLKRTSRWRFRYAARMVRRRAPCLVWVAPDG
jgi:nucleotide-binding universal stress UspA family protein